VRNSVLAAGVLDAASVLVDVFFTVVVGIAVVVAYDLARRSLRSVRDRKVQQQQDDAAREPMPVTSWRPSAEPPPSVALPAAPPSAGTYGTPRRVGPRFPEDPGRLL
jgi:hypothetical protein